MTSVRLQPIRSFVAKGSELAAALGETEPWLASAIDRFGDELPLPPAVTSFVAAPFFRPPTSHRAFYYWPAMLGEGDARRAVIAFKGLEPCVPDIDALLRHLERPCFSPHSMAEHLAIEEQKVPACSTLSEALEEAERAAAIQTAHLRAYGNLARLPLPLFVFRHSDATAERMLVRFQKSLSAAALCEVEPLLAAGLGVYVYYYPTPPVRVKDIDFLLQSLVFSERANVLASMCDPEEVIRRWVSILTRMLYLGFLPCSLSSLHTGACCQPQNACFDGGFVDLDSLTLLSELRDDTAVYAALQFTTECMLRTLRSLVAGSTDPVRKESPEIRVDLHYLTQHLFARFQSAFETEARPGLELDPRIVRYFTAPRSYAELVERLGTYYSGASPEFDAKSREFVELGPFLVRASRDY